jgi:hypothetical protein
MCECDAFRCDTTGRDLTCLSMSGRDVTCSKMIGRAQSCVTRQGTKMLYGTQFQVPAELVDEVKSWIQHSYLDIEAGDPTKYQHLDKEWQKVGALYAKSMYVALDGTSVIVDTYDWTSQKRHWITCKKEYAELLRLIYWRHNYQFGRKVQPSLSRRGLRFIIRHCLSESITNREEWEDGV